MTFGLWGIPALFARAIYFAWSVLENKLSIPWWYIGIRDYFQRTSQIFKSCVFEA